MVDREWKHKHLYVPDQWKEYWSAYPQGYTILEALLDWVHQVNNMADHVNDFNKRVNYFRDELDTFKNNFDDNLQNEVTRTLTDWQSSGFLDVVIGEALETKIDNVEKQAGISVVDFGAFGEGEDYTEEINNAIQYAHTNGIKYVNIPDGLYMVEAGNYEQVPRTPDAGIIMEDGVHLRLSTNAILKAKPSSGKGYNIIHAFRKKDFSIVGGRIVGERYEHEGSDGEWGHGINLLGCENVYIETHVSDCWGDGVYLGRGGIDYPNRNITLKVVCDNNRRQGISITHAENVYVNDSVLSNTNGTAPQAGIDIEPNADEFCKNIFINNLLTTGNSGAGVQVYARATGAVVDGIYLNNVEATNNRYGVLLRQALVKNVIGSNIHVVNNSDNGLRCVDGVSDIKVDNIVATGTNGNAISLQGSNIALSNIQLIDNVGDVNISSNSKHITINGLHATTNDEIGSDSTLAFACFNSSRIFLYNINIEKPNCDSVMFFNGCSDLTLKNITLNGGIRYPLRVSNTTRANITSVEVISTVLLDNDVYTAFRLDDGTSHSFLKGISILEVGTRKFRYGVQLANDTHNNKVIGGFFEGMYTTAPLADLGVNNIIHDVFGRE